MLIQVKRKNAILNSDFISLMVVDQVTGKDDGTYRILLEIDGSKCGWDYEEYPSEEEAITGMEDLKKQIEQEKEKQMETYTYRISAHDNDHRSVDITVIAQSEIEAIEKAKKVVVRPTYNVWDVKVRGDDGLK